MLIDDYKYAIGKYSAIFKKFFFIAKAFPKFMIKEDSSISQVSFIVGGTIAAQILNILTLPILSRIYSPYDFGILAVYSAIVSVLCELTGLRYLYAIPLPKLQRFVDAVVWLSIVLQLVYVGLIVIVLLLFGELIFSIFAIPQITAYFYLIPIGILGIGVYNIISQWSIRLGFFHSIARTRITQSLSCNITKILIGFIGIKPSGLLVGTIFGQAGGIFSLLSEHIRKNGMPLFRYNDIKKVAIKYRKFPLYNTWFGLTNTIGGQIPVMMLSSVCGAGEAGLFNMACTLLSLPTTFVGQAIGQVFLQKASIARHSGDLPRYTSSVFLVLMQFGLFPILFISFWGTMLFSFFLGSKWGVSGAYALALSPWLAIAFVYSPLSVLYVVLERHKEAVFSEGCYLILRILSLWIGAVLFSDALISVLLFSASGFIVLFLRIMHILKMAGNNIRNSLNKSIPIMIEAILFSGIPYLFYCNGVRLCICVLLSLIFIALYLYRSYRLYEAEMISLGGMLDGYRDKI